MELRRSSPAWKADAFCAGVRSKELPRLSDLGVVAALLRGWSGVFLGEPDALRVDGGGMRTASSLLLTFSFVAGVCSGVDGFLGDANILASVAVASCCPTFSLSSSYMFCTSMTCAFGNISTATGPVSSSAMLTAIEGFRCLLALLLAVSTSVTNGELGGPSKSIMLGSTSCAEGESILRMQSCYIVFWRFNVTAGIQWYNSAQVG